MILLFALLAGLEGQTILRTLDAHFPGAYLLVDIESKRVLGSSGLDPNVPIAIGSLVKPFTTIAYGEANGFRYPDFTCTGKDCWLSKGHGHISIVDAIAHSCNAYFLSMADRMNPANVVETLIKLNLSPPLTNVDKRTLAGVGSAWKFAPHEIAAAYAEIARRWAQPGMREVVAGMRGAAKKGTGKQLGTFAMAKTGTAPCDHDAGDGFVIAMFPADSLRYVLMVRLHNATGARAAAALAPALLRIRNGK